MTIPLGVALKSATPRARTEDRGLILPERGVFAVFDGMGGGADADVAAGIAERHVRKAVESLPVSIHADAMEVIIASMLRGASGAVHTHAVSCGNDAATTASLCVLKDIEGGVLAGIGNVGDSRVYTLDPMGIFTQVTIDDGPIPWAGYKEPEIRMLQRKFNNVTDAATLSPDERRLFARRHLMTQVLGDAVIEPRVTVLTIGIGWTIILMTDGIHDNLTDVEIGDILRGAASPEDAVHALLAQARARMEEESFRSHEDDMTAIVIALGDHHAPRSTAVNVVGAVSSKDSARLSRMMQK